MCVWLPLLFVCLFVGAGINYLIIVCLALCTVRTNNCARNVSSLFDCQGEKRNSFFWLSFMNEWKLFQIFFCFLTSFWKLTISNDNMILLFLQYCNYVTSPPYSIPFGLHNSNRISAITQIQKNYITNTHKVQMRNKFKKWPLLSLFGRCSRVAYVHIIYYYYYYYY